MHDARWPMRQWCQESKKMVCALWHQMEEMRGSSPQVRPLAAPSLKRSFARLFEAAPRGLALGGNGGRGRGVAGVTCGRGGENPTETCTYLVTGPESQHGLGAQPGIRSLADPCNGFQPG